MSKFLEITYSMYVGAHLRKLDPSDVDHGNILDTLHAYAWSNHKDRALAYRGR